MAFFVAECLLIRIVGSIVIEIPAFECSTGCSFPLDVQFLRCFWSVFNHRFLGLSKSCTANTQKKINTYGKIISEDVKNGLIQCTKYLFPARLSIYHVAFQLKEDLA